MSESTKPNEPLHSDVGDAELSASSDSVGDRLYGKPINELHRFRLLAVSLFASICVSTMFGFGLVGAYIREKHNFTQSQLTTITTVGSVFGQFILPFGALYDFAGPRPVLCISVSFFCLGTLLLALTFTDHINGSVARYSVFYAIMSIGCSTFDLGSLVTALTWFPRNRGHVVGLLKTMTGLGSSVLSTIYICFFLGEYAHFYYFLIAFVLFFGSLNLWMQQLPSYHLVGYQRRLYTDEEQAALARTEDIFLLQKPPMFRFVYGFVLILTLLVFLFTVNFVVAFVDVTHETRVAVASVAMALVLLLSALCLPIPRWAQCFGNALDASTRIAREPLTEAVSPPYTTSFWHNLLTPDLWIIFFVGFCVEGAQLVINDNVPQIYEAINGDINASHNALYVSLHGLGSGLGRILMSMYEVGTQRGPMERRVLITTSYFMAPVLMIAEYVLFLTIPPNGLAVPFFLNGLANGCYAAAIALTVRTLYSRDVAKHYNLMSVATMLALIALNRFAFGELYDRHVGLDGGPCHGRICVRDVFLIMLALTVVGLLLTGWMHIRYKRYVQRRMEETRKRLSEHVESGNIHGVKDAHEMNEEENGKTQKGIHKESDEHPRQYS